MKTYPKADGEKKNTETKAERIFRGRVKKRLLPVFVMLAVLLCALVGRIFYIVATSSSDYETKILDLQSTKSSTMPFRRGTITDRNSTVLATSERKYKIILEAKNILDVKEKDGVKTYNEEKITETLNGLTMVFGFDAQDLRNVLLEKENSYYIPYSSDIDEDKKEEFEAYVEKRNEELKKDKKTFSINGVVFETEYKRVYPFNEFACSVLGFSGKDAGRGNWGIEEFYNDLLVGVNGKTYRSVNAEGISESTVVDPEDGNTIVSTIDYSIQLAAQNAIDSFLSDHDAENVAAIVMNPKNAEILALATDKKFDLNNPSDLTYCYTAEEIAAMTDEEKETARSMMWKNFAVADAYEPGSTAKPFTVAAALESDLVNEESHFNCTGAKTYGSGEVTIHCNSREGHGNINLAQGLMYSCNVAMMDIAELIGKDIFTKYQLIFGFGRQCGIDLPGETAGLVYQADKMGTVDLATNSFGQNFNVNMVQLASAFCSLVNGGNYYQPHIVRQILSSDGQVKKNVEPVLVRRTVSKDTSEFIKNALFETVSAGTAKTAVIEGYSIGGKTGTAEKQPRSDKKYLVSFIAAAPIEDPEILIYVIVDNPTVGAEEEVSARLAIAIEKNIMEAIIPYTNIKASDYSAVNAEALGNIFGGGPEYTDEVALSNIEGETRQAGEEDEENN